MKDKKPNKDTTVKVNATFNQILQASIKQTEKPKVDSEEKKKD